MNASNACQCPTSNGQCLRNSFEEPIHRMTIDLWPGMLSWWSSHHMAVCTASNRYVEPCQFCLTDASHLDYLLSYAGEYALCFYKLCMLHVQLMAQSEGCYPFHYPSPSCKIVAEKESVYSRSGEQSSGSVSMMGAGNGEGPYGYCGWMQEGHLAEH